MKLLATIALLACCFGCYRAKSPTEVDTALTNADQNVKALKQSLSSDPRLDPNTWLRVIRVTHCEDGTYEVKTDLTLRAKVLTAGEAHEERMKWANELVERSKTSGPYGGLPVLPDCGQRVE